MAGRTALDYRTRDDLIEALQKTDNEGNVDWLVEYDESTSEDATEEYETERLSVLKSYDILETQRELEFDEITNEVKDYFHAPFAVVTLVDMGRQWFKSIQGMDVAETPRCISFCTHVVQRKTGGGTSPVLVVPDASKDERFKNNPLVADGPKIRFYAGAPLISPEGPKLGSLCIIDVKPRPDLTPKEKQRLQDYASQVVYHMIARLP